MAITRLSNSGIKTGGVLKYDTALAGYPGVMPAPTAADGGTGSTATITFSAVSGATSYTAISSPGSFTGTGAGSPITVSGLTAGTAYTFRIRANNAVGSGAYSAASNTVTPAVPGGMDLIEQSASTGWTSYTFSSIPSTYRTLYLVARIDGNTDQNQVNVRVNGISTGTYQMRMVRANPGTWAGQVDQPQNNNAYTLPLCGSATADGSSQGYFRLLLPGAQSTVVRNVHGTWGSGQSAAINTQYWYYAGGAARGTSAAYTSVTIALSGSATGGGTQIALFGLKE